MSDFISSYLDFTAHQETTERIHRWVAISVLAGALERRVWLPRGHYILFPNLYVFVIGPSGKVKKSTSTAIGVDLLRELPEFKIMSERLTAASLIEQLSCSGKTFQCAGREIRQSPSYAYGSELNVFLGEVFGSIAELLTTFYDCVPHDSSKPWVYETKMGGATRIFGPCLNILGASTPAWLIRAIPPSEMEGGFASRVVFVVEHDQRRAIAWPELECPGEAHEEKRRFLIARLKRVYELSGPFKITRELYETGRIWYEEHQRSSGKNLDLRFSGYYARKFDTALKLSMLLSVSEGDSMTINTSHFEQAIVLLNDVEAHMFDAFGSRGENPNAVLTDRVWKILAQNAPAATPMSVLLQTFRRDANAGKILEVITDLRAMGRVHQGLTTNRHDLAFTPVRPEARL